MWRSLLVVPTLLIPISLAAQTTRRTPSTATKSTTNITRAAKDLVGKVADSVASDAATSAMDSVLGKKGASAAALRAAGQVMSLPTCASGQVLYPAPTALAPGTPSAMAATGGSAMPTSGASLLAAARRKFSSKKPDSLATSVTGAAVAQQFLCGTPEQATAAIMQAQQLNAQTTPGGQPGMTSVGSMLAATPQGMMVSGAMAAAPMAGAAAKKLGGMFSRGQTRESMATDLVHGKLQLRAVKFVEGTDMVVSGSDKDIANLVEALKAIDGQFILNIPGESDGQSAPDAAVASRRLAKIAGQLLAAGVPADRVTTRGVLPPGLDPKAPAPKPGEARVELIRMPKDFKP